MHPGPIDDSVLTKQPNHRSTGIWNGEVQYLVLTTALIFMFSLNFSKFFQSCISSCFKVLTTAIIFINFAGPGPT